MSNIQTPMHVGEFIFHTYMEQLDLSVTTLASKLDVSQSALSRLINKKSDLSYDMAIKLSHVLGRSPESWMNIQTTYSLYLAKKSVNIDSLEKITF